MSFSRDPRLRLWLVLWALQGALGGQIDAGWFDRRPPRPALELLLQGAYGKAVGVGGGGVPVDTLTYNLKTPAAVEELLRHAETSVKALRTVLTMEARIVRASLEDSRAACLLLARIAYADWWHGPEAGGATAYDPHDDDILTDRRFEQLLEAVELNLDDLDVVDLSRLIFALQRHGHYDAALRQRALERLAMCLAISPNVPFQDTYVAAPPEPPPILCSVLELATVMCVLRIQLTAPPRFLRQQLAYAASQRQYLGKEGKKKGDDMEDDFGWWDACCTSFAGCAHQLSRAFADVMGPGGAGAPAPTWHPGHVTMKALACATWATDSVLDLEGLASRQLENIGRSVELISECTEHACAGGALGDEDVDTAVLLTKCNIAAANAAAISSLTTVLELLNPRTVEGRTVLSRIGDERFCDFVAMLVRASETMPGKSRKALLDTLDLAFKDDLVKEARRRISGKGLGLGDKKRSLDLQVRLIYQLGKLGVTGEDAAALCVSVLLYAHSIMEGDGTCSRTGSLPLPTKTAARLVRATGSILENDDSPGQVLPNLMGRLCGGMIVACVQTRQILSPGDVADMLEGLTKLGHRSRPFQQRLFLLFLRDHTDGVRGMEKTVMLRGLSRLAMATSRANLPWPRLYMTLLDTLQESPDKLETFRQDFVADVTGEAPAMPPRFPPEAEAPQPFGTWSHAKTESGLTIAERIRLDWALGVSGWSGLRNDLLEPLFAPHAGEIENMNPSTLAMLVEAVADGARAAAADFVEAITLIRTSDRPRTIARALRAAQAARSSFRFRMFAFEKLLRVLKPTLLSFSPAEIANIAASFAVVIASAAEARPLDTHLHETRRGGPARPEDLWRVPLPDGLLKRFVIEAERWVTTFTEEELATLTWCAFESISHASMLTSRYAEAAGFPAEDEKPERGERATAGDIRAVFDAINAEVKSRTEAQRGGRRGAFHLGSLRAFMSAITEAVE